MLNHKQRLGEFVVLDVLDGAAQNAHGLIAKLDSVQGARGHLAPPTGASFGEKASAPSLG